MYLEHEFTRTYRSDYRNGTVTLCISLLMTKSEILGNSPNQAKLATAFLRQLGTESWPSLKFRSFEVPSS